MVDTFQTRRMARLAAVVLLSAQALTSVHAAHRETYSLAQQVAGVDAVNTVLQKLDQLEPRLLQAYGSNLPVIRMEELKHPNLGRSASEPTVQSALERLHDQGAKVIQRIASFEPLWSACGLTHESIEVLGTLSDHTAQLLEQRDAAKEQEVFGWSQEGGAQGLERLKSAHELNCRPVRVALTSTLAALQDAYAPLTQALGSLPEGASVTSATTKPAPLVVGHSVPAVPSTDVAVHTAPAAPVTVHP